HEGHGVALVARHRQDQATHRLARVRGRFPVPIRGPAFGDRLPALHGEVTLPRATAVFAMSMTTVPYEPAGAAIDHGLVPIAFSRPPQGAIAGLALVARKATQPASAALRVKYAAV